MPSESDLPKEIAGGVRGLFDRIGEFFHLFDLSFFVSGGVTFSALAYWYTKQAGLSPPIPFPTWIRVVALIVACYVCGLVSFAAGRFVANYWRGSRRQRYFTDFLTRIIEAHGIYDPSITPYLYSYEKPWRLYERLWVDLREAPQHAASFTILNRYWVMAATHDGIAISCLAWMVVLLVVPPFDGSVNRFVLPVLAALAAALCFWQGHNYFKFQVREIVATLAASRSRLMADSTRKQEAPAEAKAHNQGIQWRPAIVVRGKTCRGRAKVLWLQLETPRR